MAENAHIRQNLGRRSVAARLHETNGLAVAIEGFGIVSLLLLEGQRLKDLQVWVQRIQIDGLLQVRERLSAILAGFGLEQTERGEGIGRIGRGAEDELEVSRGLFVRFGPDKRLRQTKPSRGEVGSQLACSVVELGRLLHFVANVVDTGKDEERLGLHLLDGGGRQRTAGQGDDAIIVLLPQFETGGRLSRPCILDAERIGRPGVVVVVVIGHGALKSIQSDPNSLPGVEIHRLTGRDDGTSRLDRHRAGHRGPLPKVVVGQMVLHQSVGMVDEVGRRKEANRVFGPSAVVLGSLVEGCQIENGQTDHGLDVLRVHGMGTSEGRLGTVDLIASKQQGNTDEYK